MAPRSTYSTLRIEASVGDLAKGVIDADGTILWVWDHSPLSYLFTFIAKVRGYTIYGTSIPNKEPGKYVIYAHTLSPLEITVFSGWLDEGTDGKDAVKEAERLQRGLVDRFEVWCGGGAEPRVRKKSLRSGEHLVCGLIEKTCDPVLTFRKLPPHIKYFVGYYVDRLERKRK